MSIVLTASITNHSVLPFQPGLGRVCLNPGPRTIMRVGRRSLGELPQHQELSELTQSARPDPNSA